MQLRKKKGKRDMARKKSIASIDSEIAKAQDALVKAKDRYDAVAKNLAELMEMKRQHQARAIMDAFIKSGKSYEEIMNFLNVDGD
jgi:ferritin